MRIQRGFDLDPSCKLWLPFYKYGAEQTKIWDQSGNNNHGTITGAVPASYPMLSGVELVTNGGMESGDPPTGWSATGTPETFEQSGVQKHGGSYSAHIVDSIPSYGGLRGLVFPTVTGKKYKICGWAYIVAALEGCEFFWVHGDNSFANDISVDTTAGLWLYRESIVTETAGGAGAYIGFRNAGNIQTAEFYIDDVSIQEVVGYEGLGCGFDGVDDNVVSVDSSSLRLTSQGTVLVWARTNFSNGEYEIILTKGIWDTNNYTMYHSPTNICYEIGYGGSGTTYQTSVIPLSSIPHEQWILLSFSWTTGSYVLGYLNGVFVAPSGTIASSPDTTGKDLKIGTGDDGGQAYKGQIGEVLIFNRALSANEIRSYFEKTRSRYGV